MGNELTKIIIGILLFSLAYYFFNKNNKPYFKKRAVLKDQFNKTTLSDDWEKRQEINLEILWLETIKSVKSEDLFKRNDNYEVKLILKRLSKDEIELPDKWILDDLYYFPFTQSIISGYGKVLAESEYELYKPEKILPFPKSIIIKAIHYTLDYLNYDNSLYYIPNKRNVADHLESVKFILINNFVDTTNINLPKKGIENMKIGSRLLHEKQSNKEKDNLNLINWRSEYDWINAANKYNDRNEFDLALKCIERAKNINSNIDNIKQVEELLYQNISEHYKNENDTDTE